MIIRLALRRRDDRGASAVEYALLIALIAAVIIGGVALLGGALEGAFDIDITGGGD